MKYNNKKCYQKTEILLKELEDDDLSNVVGGKCDESHNFSTLDINQNVGSEFQNNAYYKILELLKPDKKNVRRWFF